jgi:GDP-L-fucose synthase
MEDRTTPVFSLDGRRVWVAGHRGMVGSAIVRRLAQENCEVLTVPRAGLDLRRQEQVERWMADNRPDTVFLAAATVGGIHANNTRPAEFIYDNLAIEANVIHTAREIGVAKLVFLGSACIYPREIAQPMAEDALLTGPLEPTNEWYAIAKIAGIKLCQAYRRQYGCDFISAMPNNLYGSGDNFDLANSHVLPALMRKIHEAKMAELGTVTLWGSGAPLREFMHVDDLADAPHVNIGSGEEISIRDLADAIAETVGWQGQFVYDSSKPDGMARKLLDVSRLHAMGWSAKTGLREGLDRTYRWFLDAGSEHALRK